MSVETGTEPLLVKEMRNETDTASENKEAVEDTHVQVIFSLLGAESTTVAHQIDEADGNTSVNVEDQVILLRRGNSLDGNGVVEQLVVGEVLRDELLDKLDTEIGVGARLNPVADTRD